MKNAVSIAAFALCVALAGPLAKGASAAEVSTVARAPLALMASEAEAHDGQRVRVRAAGRAARVRVRPGRPVVRPGVVRPGIVRPGIGRPGVVGRPGIVRPGRIIVRPWRPRPHYGAIVAGVALGAIITAAAIGVAPAAPASNVCWYWEDPAQTQGYWDYCN